MFVVVLMLAICGLACPILVPHYDNGHDNPKKLKLSVAKLYLTDLRDAVDQFRADNGRLPTAAEGLSVLTFYPAYGAPESWSNMHDPWGHCYLYRLAPMAGVAFEVRSVGPDGRLGTADDIVWQ